MKRRRQSAGTPDLGPATAAILLAGWVDGHPPPGVPQEPHGFDHEFLTLYDTGGIAKLWRQYEPWLREQARAWGWVPTFTHNGTRMFYGECVAHGGQE
jgi:hypothetical protein